MVHRRDAAKSGHSRILNCEACNSPAGGIVGKVRVASWQATPVIVVLVGSKVPAEAVVVAAGVLAAVVLAAVVVVVVIVVVVAGSKAPFVAVAGTLLILVAVVQRSLVVSSLVALMD
jgi:hypothetical protein